MRTKRLTCSHHQRGFYLETSIPVSMHMCTCDCVCVRNAREHRAERTGRHIIRGNGGTRAARDARNYPQLSRAYAIHVVDGGVTVWSSARLLDKSLRIEFKHGVFYISRGDGDMRRYACEINDIFQNAGVSLVHASLSLPLSLSSFSAHSRSVVRMFLTYRRRSRHNHRPRFVSAEV